MNKKTFKTQYYEQAAVGYVEAYFINLIVGERHLIWTA